MRCIIVTIGTYRQLVVGEWNYTVEFCDVL